MGSRWLTAVLIASIFLFGSTAAQAEEANGEKQEDRSMGDEISKLEEILGPERAAMLLEERARYLNEEMAILEEKELALSELERMIEVRLGELEALEKRVGELVKREEELKKARMDQLLRVYKSLKPTELRRVLWELDYDTRVRILERLQPKKVAKIIALLDPKEAARVSESLLSVGGRN